MKTNRKEDNKNKNSKKSTKDSALIRSATAEYLTFIAATGDGGVETIYADENIWLTQKMMGILYNVEPIRTKDRAYVDVLSESINNPLRFLLGWSAIVSDVLPPSSVLLASKVTPPPYDRDRTAPTTTSQAP